jgi:Adaptor complexes medium subunit family
LNLLVGSNGAVLHSEIVGAVKMKSFLSGMPELKLGLNDKLLFESTGRTSGKVKTGFIKLALSNWLFQTGFIKHYECCYAQVLVRSASSLFRAVLLVLVLC